MSKKLILGLLGVAAACYLLADDDDAPIPPGAMPGGPPPWAMQLPGAPPIGVPFGGYPAPIQAPIQAPMPVIPWPTYGNAATGVIIGGDRQAPVIGLGDGRVFMPGDFGG